MSHLRPVRRLTASLLLAALPLLAAALPLAAQEAAAPAPVEIAAGPMVGHVWESGAKVWVQVTGEAVLALDVRRAGTGEPWRPSRSGGIAGDGRELYRRVWADTRFAGTLTVDGLLPATAYEYRLRAEDRPLAVPTTTLFTTAAPPGAPEDLRVAFGSCAGDWGEDPSQPIFRAVARQRPDLFLFLGDNVYYNRDTQEWAHPELMWARYEQGRRIENLQPLLRRTPTYAIWDDHDYGPNDADKIYAWKDLSLEIFRAFWANPSYGSDGVPGVWHRATRGQVDFFFLDGRFHRDPNDAPDDPHKSQWGPVQRAWLADALRDSRAVFKVIATGGQFLARYHDFESHDLYRHEREWLLDLIRRHRIGGVLFLSGDRHLGEILRWQPPEVPYPLYELTSSPLAAGLWQPDGEGVDPPERLPGSLVVEENFGLLEITFPEDGDPRLTFQHHDVDGRPIGVRLELRASELLP
jgi:alkaline phosphatase D